jgi:hypothetical protein
VRQWRRGSRLVPQVNSRDAVNPSVEALTKTSMFSTARESTSDTNRGGSLLRAENEDDNVTRASHAEPVPGRGFAAFSCAHLVKNDAGHHFNHPDLSANPRTRVPAPKSDCSSVTMK